MVEKIKLLCEKNGTTIKALEKELGLGNGSIRRWDDTAPSVDKVLLVAKRFGVTVEWLKGESDEKSPPPTEGEGLTAIQREALEYIHTLSDDELRRFIAMGKAAFEKGGEK